MSHLNNPTTWDPIAAYQRRSFSFGDSPISTNRIDDAVVDESSSASCRIDDENDHEIICAPLPRSDNAPTAKTCWLVYSKNSFQINPFCISRSLRSLFTSFRSTLNQNHWIKKQQQRELDPSNIMLFIID